MRPEHLNVLIVDSDANVREQITGWLKADGFHAVAEPSGEAAVRRLCEGLNNARAIEAAFGKIEEG